MYINVISVQGMNLIIFLIIVTAIHQKGFILYILSSHLSFLLILKIYHVIWPHLNDLQKCSYRNKLFLFILSLTCMSLMAYYYYRHFIHCDPLGKSGILMILINLIALYDILLNIVTDVFIRQRL